MVIRDSRIGRIIEIIIFFFFCISLEKSEFNLCLTGVFFFNINLPTWFYIKKLGTFRVFI